MKTEDLYRRIRRKRIKFNVALFILLVLFALISVAFGSTKVGIAELFRIDNMIFRVRAARIIMAIVAGAGLGVSGALLQGILRNPFAEPYVLGISGGAGLGAVAAIMLGVASSFLPAVSFAAGLIAILVVYGLARQAGKVPIETLILSGVIVSAVSTSVLLFLVSVSTSARIHDALWWMLGTLEVFDMKMLVISSLVVIAGIVVSLLFSKELNAISISEEDAIHLGIDVELLKKTLFVVASLITGAIVSMCGLIGFVGFIVPHLVRLLTGPDHRVLLPASALGGALLLVICDVFARAAMPPYEIPIGVITAILGGPFFIILLRKKRKLTTR